MSAGHLATLSVLDHWFYVAERRTRPACLLRTGPILRGVRSLTREAATIQMLDKFSDGPNGGYYTTIYGLRPMEELRLQLQ